MWWCRESVCGGIESVCGVESVCGGVECVVV